MYWFSVFFCWIFNFCHRVFLIIGNIQNHIYFIAVVWGCTDKYATPACFCVYCPILHIAYRWPKSMLVEDKWVDKWLGWKDSKNKDEERTRMKKVGKCRKCAECSGKGVRKRRILFGQPHWMCGIWVHFWSASRLAGHLFPTSQLSVNFPDRIAECFVECWIFCVNLFRTTLFFVRLCQYKVNNSHLQPEKRLV